MEDHFDTFESSLDRVEVQDVERHMDHAAPAWRRQIGDHHVVTRFDESIHDMRSDETCSTRDQDAHLRCHAVSASVTARITISASASVMSEWIGRQTWREQMSSAIGSGPSAKSRSAG